jgi:Ice-binding-like/VPDSG-CTERM motif
MTSLFPLSPIAARTGVKRIAAGFAFAVALTFLQLTAMANPAFVNLGTSSDYAVLAGSGITVTGPTTITGNIGTFPTTTITGFGNVTLNGTNHAGDAVTQQAKNDLVIAYNDAAGRSSDVVYGGGFDLVGLTLPSGVYTDSSSLFLSGTLTLDAQGDPSAVWIFQTGSTLITASNSTVDLIGGAQACHVFWQVGTSATLGTGTDFNGNILAMTSITLNTGASVNGRLLARNGAVTLDNNTITRAVCNTGGTGGGTGGNAVPDSGNTLVLFGVGLTTLLAVKRRLFPTAA